MEDEKDLMSMFSDNDFNLNMDFLDDDDKHPEIDQDDESDESEEDDKNIDKDTKEITEQKDAEEVGDEEDDKSEENDSKGESSPNLYSSIANVLHEQGIIPSLDSSQEIKTPEDLVNTLKKQIDLEAQAQLDEYIKNLDVSKIAENKREQVSLDSITDDTLKDNLDLAKNIIFKDYLNQGLSEERATRFLKQTIDQGEDLVLEEAKESLNNLKVFRDKQIEQEKVNAQNEIKVQRERQTKLDLDLKNKIYNSEELIKGVKFTKALQDRVYKSMTEIVHKNPETGALENKLIQDRSKDPIGFDTRMYSIYELTNGFTDFSKLAKDTKSKAVSELETALRKTKFEDNGTPIFMQDSQSYDGIGDELVL